MRHAALVVLLALAPAARAAPVNLTESPAPGDAARYALDLEVSGHLVVTQEGKKGRLKLDARARHRFAERTLAVADGLPATSARHYDEAAAEAVVGGEKDTHALPADRRLVVARRTPDGLVCYCPGGPVSRDELDLVTEHFDPHCLPGLLPGKAVTVGDTWPVGPAAAQAACLFDGLLRNDLVGKLTEEKDGVATFTVTGTAEGIEYGAKVTLTVSATGKFNVAAGRVVEIVWKQSDDREQGPVSPASKLEATATLKREVLAAAPKELADVEATGDPPAALTRLRFADPKGRYQFDYPRDWHVTGQAESHVVLRLLDRGEFVVQATVTAWAKADPGKHTPADEFKKAVGASPGWVATKVVADGEVLLDGGRWLYRVVAEGKMDDQPVVQGFYLLAGPGGDQVAVTFALKPDQVKAVGTRDVDLVAAITFGRK